MADAITSLQISVEAKDATTHILKGVESSVIRFVGAVSASLAAIRVAVFPVEAAASLQKELLNVGKTTNYTNSELERLSAGLKEISYRTNVAAEDLAKMAAAGGQMGLGKEGTGGIEGLLIFTESASRLSSVLDITAQEAGDAIGRLSNIFHIGIMDAEKIASTLNEISNNSTAKGKDLIDMVQRIGTAGGLLNLKQAAALAATGRDLGLSVETVGTSFNKIYLGLQLRSAETAKVIGMPVQQFSDLLRTDGIAALKLYLDALGKMGATERTSTAQMITGGGRIFALVSALVNDANTGYVLLNKHISEASKGFDLGTSAILEQQRVLQGLLAQATILKNVFIGVATTIGDKALPYITDLVQALQEWGKSPEVLNAFGRFAEVIGYVATKVVDLITTLSGMAGVMGPLLRILQIFVGIKIINWIVSTTAALVGQAAAAANTTRSWFALLTAHKATTQAMIQSAKELEAANVKAVAAGGVATPLSRAGKVSLVQDALFGKYWQAQDAAAASAAAEAASAERIAKLQADKSASMSKYAAQYSSVLANQKAEADLAKQAALANGASRRDAVAAGRSRAAQFNLPLSNIRAQQAAERTSMNTLIAKEQAVRRVAAVEAAANAQTLAGMDKIKLAMSTVIQGLGGVASAALTMGRTFLIAGGWIITALAVGTFFLDMFGWLDAATNAWKKFWGIATDADAAKARAENDRAKAAAEEERQIHALAGVYDQVRKDWDKSRPLDSGLGGFNADLVTALNRVELVSAKFKDVANTIAKAQAGVGYTNAQLSTLQGRLAEAKRVLGDLEKTQGAPSFGGVMQSLYLPAVPTDPQAYEKRLDAAKIKVKELTEQIGLLSKARDSYEKSVAAGPSQLQKVSEDQMKQLSVLMRMYDADGFKLLQTLTGIKQKEQELTEATKAEQAIRDKSDANAGYIAAQQKVVELTAQVNALKTAFKEAQATSTVAGNVFLASLVPDAAKASFEQVKQVLDTIGSATGQTTTAMHLTAQSIRKDILDTQKALADIELKRKSKISDAVSPLTGSSLVQLFSDTTEEKLKKVNEEMDLESAKLKDQLSTLLAKQAINENAIENAKKLRRELLANEGVSLTPQQVTKNSVSRVAYLAGMKQLKDLEIKAFDQVRIGAEAAADSMAAKWKAATNDIANSVSTAFKDIQQIQSYFAARRITIKLANFDIQNSQNDAFVKKSQNDWIEMERKRLQALGLSTEEITKQVDMLKEMVDVADKARKQSTDEIRQRTVIDDLQKRLNDDADLATKAQEKALDLSKQQQAALARGDFKVAQDFGDKAAQQAEIAKIAVEELNKTFTDYKTEAAKPIIGPFNAYYIVDDAAIKNNMEKVASIRTEVAKSSEEVFKQSTTTFAKYAVEQQGIVNNLKLEANGYQKQLEAIFNMWPELARAQTAMGEEILKQANGLSGIAENLQSISKTDFRDKTVFPDMSSQRADLEKMDTSLKSIAESYGVKLANAIKTNADLPNVLMGSLNITEAKAASAVAPITHVITQAVEQGTAEAKPAVGEVKFPSVREDLQTAINARGPYEAQVNLKPSSTSVGSAPGFAGGGYISGSGTGTSDSILSWLSNGEYVNDAKTTSAFGPAFFATLKAIAHGGRSAITGLAGVFGGGLKIPAFAGGGFVSSSLAGAGIGAMMGLGDGNVLDTVNVKIDVGGKSFSLRSERDQATDLARTLRNISRSTG